MVELKVTEEAVIAASRLCPNARLTLQTLFPTVFEGREEKTVPYVNGGALLFPAGHPMHGVVMIRHEGPHAEEGLVLKTDLGYTFALVQDGPSALCLVVRKSC